MSVMEPMVNRGLVSFCETSRVYVHFLFPLICRIPILRKDFIPRIPHIIMILMTSSCRFSSILDCVSVQLSQMMSKLSKYGRVNNLHIVLNACLFLPVRPKTGNHLVCFVYDRAVCSLQPICSYFVRVLPVVCDVACPLVLYYQK